MLTKTAVDILNYIPLWAMALRPFAQRPGRLLPVASQASPLAQHIFTFVRFCTVFSQDQLVLYACGVVFLGRSSIISRLNSPPSLATLSIESP